MPVPDGLGPTRVIMDTVRQLAAIVLVVITSVVGWSSGSTAWLG